MPIRRPFARAVVVSLLATALWANRIETAENFYVVGKDIVDPDGNIFFPVGGNVVGTDFWFPGSWATVPKVEAMKRWGWSAVRIVQFARSLSDPDGMPWKGEPDDWSQLDEIIEAITSEGIVAILDAHDAPAFSDQPFEAYDWVLIDYWTEAVNRYGVKPLASPPQEGNPLVWFNVMNEPVGGKIACTDDPDCWLPLNSRYVDLIRNLGAENVIVVDGAVWGQDYGPWEGLEVSQGAIPSLGASLAANRCNIVFSFHPYCAWSDQAELTEYIELVQAQNLALLVGEYGMPTTTLPPDYCTHETFQASFDNIFELAPLAGIGMTIWHATPGDNWWMTEDGDHFFDSVASTTHPDDPWQEPTNLSPQGQRLWNLIHNWAALGLPGDPRDRGPFPGNLADSNCAGAQFIFRDGFETGDLGSWQAQTSH